ncbi:centromere-associated protein E isoform X2 [Pygocentrus nattereri]|uniref:centromere-associated protein E isoform X2 n=1 Tax=Pygocentrus nattereri TaxID=42514 RepID=UPI001891BC04|nr:centromere-associated protein E isoform X2 [Pygocentrus nattereri]
MSEESAVKVCVRVRPLIKREEAAAESAEPVQLYWKADKQAIHQTDDDGNLTKSFGFDRVFSAEESTSQLYQDIAKPLVVSTVEGYNGTIFAYGQTSSGKTFTMMGSDHTPGVIPLAMSDVFQTIKNCPKKEFLLRVSYMEIYNETVTDLLCDSWKRKPLEIREGNYKNVYVADLTEELVTSPEQALGWIRKGEKNRHYGKTKMNQRSSRSHTIFRMILESRERSDPMSGENADGAIIVSHLNLVDLAGAERASQTGAEGARFKEGCNINRSLFTLGQVIKKLSDESQKGFTNYRDSKLTRILQNSLGGNAKTVIICTITPATVDETLSTLQFASAAKRMKNDPHVTEVSDDGALLRRYRNEIVDLKRRLQEVSSVTQTTVTEKETLCQLLQEKDQLQREQSDRIRNLTKLLVTASNVVQVQKIPKRRMTWGGKLLRSAQSVAEDHGSADLSFAEPFLKKRRADITVNEEGEDLDDFYSIAEDTSIDTEMNQSNVTMRSSAEGICPDSPQLMFRVECLERQLETEAQEKQKAEEKSLALEQKMEEIEKQLQTLEQQLENEVQQKQKAEEKCSALELKVVDLEKPSDQEKTHNACENCKYIGETIQLCETLSFERETIAAERDILKQTIELITEDAERLKQDNEALLKDKEALLKDKETLLRDMEERKDAEEFEKLEEESKKDYERELEAEISALKKSSTNAEDLVQKLNADLEKMSVKLKKKEDLVTELQTMSGKDLVQEVTQLRRSLDDAEVLSLETKKEWAFLRTENLSLKERDATLTAQYDHMENEVKTLQSQLEKEKSRFKKMQADLQKELLGAFDENTKLTALLDGKVPKNVLDNLTLEKTVVELKKELEKSQEKERALQSEMEAMKALPAKVDDLLSQVCELNRELYSAQEERDNLLSTQASSTEEYHKLKEEAEKAQEDIVKIRSVLADAEIKEAQLSQQHKETAEQLAVVQTDLEHTSEENVCLLRAVEEAKQKSVQLAEELESLRCERDHLSEEAKDVQICHQELQNLRLVVISTTEERDQLQEMIQGLKEERDQLKKDMEENVEMMIENQEELRTALEKIKVQQDQIVQLEAQTALLESKLSNSHGTQGSLEDLQNQVKQLKEELQCACAEKDNILAEKHLNNSELQRMQANIASLIEERDQLQEILQGLREEKTQLKREMEEKDEMILCLQAEVNKEQLAISEDQHSNLSYNVTEEKEAQLQQMQDLKKECEELAQENTQLRRELQDLSEKVSELTEALHTVQEERGSVLAAQTTLNEENKSLKEEIEKTREELLKMETELVDSQLKEAQLSQQLTENTEQLAKVQRELEQFSMENNKLLASLEEANLKSAQFGEELGSLRCEREQLLSEKMKEACNPEEVEGLHETVISITEERNQLQEILQSLREEHKQLKKELEESNDMLIQAQDKVKHSELASDQTTSCVQDELLQQTQQLQARLHALTEENQQMKLDLQENVEMMIENQGELRAALDNVKDLQDKVLDLESQRDQLESRLSSSDCCEESKPEDLKMQIKQLSEELRAVYDEKDSLQSENAEIKIDAAEFERVQTSITSITEERDQLLNVLQELREEKSQLKNDLEEKDGMIMQLREELQSASAERDQFLCLRTKDDMEDTALKMIEANVAALTEERDQLLEILQGLREEKNQMKTDLEEKDGMLMQLREELHFTSAEKDNLLADNKAELEACQVSILSLTEERDHIRDENKQLKMELEDKNEMMMHLREELQSLTAEKDHLLLERSKDGLPSLCEIEQVQAEIASITEERDQLLEIVHSLREEKIQLRAEFEGKNDMMLQLKEEVQSITAEKDCLLAENAKSNMQEMERLQVSILSLTEGRDQLMDALQVLSEEKNQLSTDLRKKDEMVLRLKEEVQSAAAEKNSLLAENAESTMQELGRLQTSVLSLTEERDQLLEVMQGLREDNNQLRKDLEEKTDMMMQLKEDVRRASVEKDHLLAESAKIDLDNMQENERLQTSIISLTEERDQLLEVIQGIREEKNQLRVDLERKDEMIQQLKQNQATERDQLLMKDASCSISDSSGLSTNINEDGDRLQELLQGVRELIQVQGELKQQKRHSSEQLTPAETREAELQQMLVLKEEVESLRNERTVLRKDLQEAAEMSKAYQEMLHSTKEELKRQQKENVDFKTQSAEKESLLNQQLSQLSEDLLSLRGSKDQLLAEKTSETQNLNTELQNLRTHITSLEEDKEKLDEMLEHAREESIKLNDVLKESEEKIHQLTQELECFAGIKDQLLNEKTHADQLQEVLNGVREERDQLRREVEEKMEELTHTEEKVQGLEKQKMVLESDVSSLSQVKIAQRTLKFVSETEASNEMLKAAFLKLQRIIDCPTPIDPLADDNSKECALFYELLAFVPKSHRAVYGNLAAKTYQLSDILGKTGETIKRLAQRHKAHFATQVQRDVASFEERRLQDLLIRRAQAPSQALHVVQEDLQEIWDQRLLELLEKRKQYLQKMNSILEVLEDGVAKHAVTLSEERQARACSFEETRALARTSDAASILRFFERELVRRTTLTERQRLLRKRLLDMYDSAVTVLKPLESESEERLREEQRENLALLPAQNNDRPKTEAELLQDKQHLSLQLQQAQRQVEVIQRRMEELKVQADASNQKHLAMLQELSSDLKAKEDLIQNLQANLKETEALAKIKMPPSAAEMEALKDKLVKMELDHIAVTTCHEKELAQLSSVLEHREEVIRKLKENLRKTQQEEEHSFVEGEQSHPKAGSQSKTLACLKETKIEELEKKTAHFESLVTKQQEEITKWKNRAYKLRESKKEAPQSPRTPSKRQPPLTESEVNSPKRAFIDSPKSKFFDVRSGAEPLSLKCPKQFFDNSGLGTMPDASSSAANSDNWWHLSNSSPRKANANMDTNGCPTQ